MLLCPNYTRHIHTRTHAHKHKQAYARTTKRCTKMIYCFILLRMENSVACHQVKHWRISNSNSSLYLLTIHIFRCMTFSHPQNYEKFIVFGIFTKAICCKKYPYIKPFRLIWLGFISYSRPVHIRWCCVWSTVWHCRDSMVICTSHIVIAFPFLWFNIRFVSISVYHEQLFIIKL